MIGITDRQVDHLQIARRFAATADDWPFAPRFDPHGRWYRRLAALDEGEVWLLTWLPGQGTDLHDHGGSAGALLVLSGALTEHTAVSDGVQTRLVAGTLTAGGGRRFGPHHVHRVVNDGDRPAVSIHVYAPSLSTMTRYRLDDGRLLVAAVDRAGAQW